MQLTIIGSGSSVINKKRKGPAFLLETARKLLLFDCGWGCGENLLRAGYDIQKLDHIFITHPHADHLGSLISLLHSMLNSGHFRPQTKRTKALYLHGYKGFKRDYEDLRRIMFPERAEQYKIRLFEYLNTSRKFSGLKITAKEVYHVPQYFHSVAYRLEAGGKIFFYSGDCGFDKKLIVLAQGADIGLFEMSIPPTMYYKLGPRPNHISAFESGLVAAKAGVKKLVLAHLYDNAPPAEIRREVRKNFAGPLIIARDLQIIRF